MRLGGIYALERIAKDSPKDQQTIMEVLTAYVRENAPRKDKQLEGLRAFGEVVLDLSKGEKKLLEEVKEYKQGDVSHNDNQPISTSDAKDKTSVKKVPSLTLPATDIQAILTVIARDQEDKRPPRLFNLDFQKTALQNANLHGAKIYQANFFGADLSGADLRNCSLMMADLRLVNLRKAIIFEADLLGARIEKGNLWGAFLYHTDLSHAHLDGADLSGATLSHIKGLTWEQIDSAIIDEETNLPPEFEAKKREKLARQRNKKGAASSPTPKP